jgi:peptidoglycan hydrolase CwlO-like protein
MRMLKHLVLALAIALTTFTGAALAESAAVTNYKQRAQRIVDTWHAQMAHFNAELDKAKADLDALNKQSPPPADLDKQVAAIQTNIKNIQASMDFATNSMRVDLDVVDGARSRHRSAIR